VVCTRSDWPPPAVDIIDVDLSDHRLLRWPVPLVRPPPVYTTITTRPWRQLDIADLRAGLLESSLCRSDTWGDLDLDGLAQLYDDVIINMLDRFIPFRTVKCRRRPSDPWFDEECRAAKRLTRRLERAARRPDTSNAAAAAAATAKWRTQRRVYRDLRNQKRESFWREKVESERSCPQ